MDLLVADNLDTIQLIAEDGSTASASPFDPAQALDRLPALYETMVATRELDEEFVNLQRQGQLALFPSSRGQEAAQVGAAAALRDTDWLFPQYRELGCFLYRGVDPAGIGAMWRGSVHGGTGLIERSVAPISIPIGTHALHAVGAAMASRWLDDGGVTVAFVGDGATSEGDVHEALNLAAVEQAPCIFYVQNNQWAISTPLSDQLRAPSIAHKAIGYGMPGVRVDGNDVLACLLVVEQAAARARGGEGPTLIEAVTYRMGPHTTSDDPSRYRDDAEVAEWAKRDPLARARAHLELNGRWDDSIEELARQRAAGLRKRLRDAVFEAPDPSPLGVFDHVFGQPSAELVRQRAMLAAELAERGI
jgi:2-oxoisovalerate dehydrogenase E1 component alpha subunit